MKITVFDECDLRSWKELIDCAVEIVNAGEPLYLDQLFELWPNIVLTLLDPLEVIIEYEGRIRYFDLRVPFFVTGVFWKDHKASSYQALTAKV